MQLSGSSLAAICSFVLCTLLLVSCGDLQQDLYLKADGSGTLETSFEIGELLSMAGGLEDMGSDVDTFSDDHLIESPPPPSDTSKNQFQLFMEKIADPEHDRDVDTIVPLISIMPDSIREKQKDLTLVNKMAVRMKSPANSGDLTLGFIMDFDSPQQLRDMISYMQSLDNGSGLGDNNPFSSMEGFLVFEADMKAGMIRIDTLYYNDISLQLGMSQDSVTSDEEIAMMEMMFGSSKIRSVIHVPGEVLSCSIPDAILTKDNKVIVEHGFMDAIRKGRIDGYTIVFKP